MLTRRTIHRSMSAALATAAFPFLAHARREENSPLMETRLMMGTFVTIKACGVSSSHAAEAMEKAFSHMASLEETLTRFQSSSPLGQLNAAGCLRDAPDPLMAVVTAAWRMNRLTHAAFDPTILPLLDRMEKQHSPLSEKERAELAPLIGMEHVIFSGRNIRFQREGMKMSLDGIAKGYIADEGASVMLRSGVGDFLIDAGGDIVAHGTKNGSPWRVAVENPGKYQGKTAYPAVKSLKNQAIATSGTYENTFDARGKANHLLSPVSGQCAALSGASVVTSSAMEADALATALCVMARPEDFMERLPNAGCMLTLPEKTVTSSRWS